MKEIQAPHKLKNDKYSIFLAGSIDMGATEDWQKKICKDLKDFDIYLYNPRRDDWDSSWEETKENKQFSEQVNWELDGLEQADLIITYFSKDSKAPITFMELGLHAKDNMVVYCPEGFYRKGNVDIVCDRYNIELHDDYDNLIDSIIDKIGNKNKIDEYKMKSFNENTQNFIAESVNLVKDKKGKKTIKEFTELIRSNNILLNEFKVFDKLHNGVSFQTENNDVVQLFVENIVTVFNKYNKKDIKEANKQLEKFVVEHNIPQIYTDNKSEVALNYLISENVTIDNIDKVSEYKHNLCEAFTSTKQSIKEDIDYDLLTTISLSKFNSKYTNLNEGDKKLINNILSANTIAEQTACFNEIKTNCLTKLNSLIKESKDINEKERLLTHKENILNKTINESNFEDELKIMLEYHNILTNFE